MGTDPQLDLDNVAMFKRDIQNQIEYENQVRLKTNGATPASTRKVPHQAAGSASSVGYEDFLAGEMTPVKKVKREPLSTAKRAMTNNLPLGTPTKPVNGKLTTQAPVAGTPPSQRISASPAATGLTPKTPFADRKEPGSTVQTLDAGSIDVDTLLQSRRTSPSTVTANFDPKKYAFRPMYQKLSEVAEQLDEQIDSYADNIVAHYGLQAEEIADPARESQQQVCCVGRIVCDSIEGGRINPSSILLETSRRLGMGSRTKLDLSQLQSFAFFPGQIVAVKGSNAGGGQFRVQEVMETPALPPAASGMTDFGRDVTVCLVAAGPFTPDSDLNFEALSQLVQIAKEQRPDQVILLGPLLDVSHPLIRSGDFDPPVAVKDENDVADSATCDTLDTLFRAVVTPMLRELPGLLIVPHPLDVLSRHPCFPQDAVPRSSLGLGKSTGARSLPNPALFSLDEASWACCAIDATKHLTLAECSRNPAERNVLARAAGHVLSQRRFYPLFPAPAATAAGNGATIEVDGEPVPVDPLGGLTAGGLASIDMGFCGLTELGPARPDVLVQASEMAAFARVLDGTIVINPGTLSKRGGPSGTYARVVTAPRTDLDAAGASDGKAVPHEVWRRTRVDIVRI